MKKYILSLFTIGFVLVSLVSFAQVSMADSLPSTIAGPQRLKINEKGTWTVNASDPNGGDISFSADWGDGNVGDGLEKISKTNLTQSATFTHKYQEKGAYGITFRLTNSNGQSSSKSTSVNIGGANSITIISPNGGEILHKGNKQKISWRDEVPSGCSTSIISCLTGGIIHGYYSINLVEYTPPCTNFCTGANSSYPIAQKAYGYSYNWNIKNIPSGSYLIMICKSGKSSTYDCDWSDKPFMVK